MQKILFSSEMWRRGVEPPEDHLEPHGAQPLDRHHLQVLGWKNQLRGHQSCSPRRSAGVYQHAQVIHLGFYASPTRYTATINVFCWSVQYSPFFASLFIRKRIQLFEIATQSRVLSAHTIALALWQGLSNGLWRVALRVILDSSETRCV